MPTWNPKLKSTCVDFQKLTKWSCFGCESLVAKSLADFGDLETHLLELMEEEFEDQLGNYVELEDLADFDFKICKFGKADLVCEANGRLHDVRCKFGKVDCCLISLIKICYN